MYVTMNIVNNVRMILGQLMLTLQSTSVCAGIRAGIFLKTRWKECATNIWTCTQNHYKHELTKVNKATDKHAVQILPWYIGTFRLY